MPKAGTRTTSKGVPHTPGQTLSDHIEARYRANPGLRRWVTAEVQRMLKEQDAARRKAQRARTRRAAQKKAR